MPFTAWCFVQRSFVQPYTITLRDIIATDDVLASISLCTEPSGEGTKLCLA